MAQCLWPSPQGPVLARCARSPVQVLIRKGGVLRNTPEFESYQRSFEPVWPVLDGLLQVRAGYERFID
jgi:hypothetical protein